MSNWLYLRIKERNNNVVRFEMDDILDDAKLMRLRVTVMSVFFRPLFLTTLSLGGEQRTFECSPPI